MFVRVSSIGNEAMETYLTVRKISEVSELADLTVGKRPRTSYQA